MAFPSDHPNTIGAALPTERLTAEFFNFDSIAPPVLVQDLSTLFVVAQPLLFYKSSGVGNHKSNAFPGVFLPCGGYGQVSSARCSRATSMSANALSTTLAISNVLFACPAPVLQVAKYDVCTVIDLRSTPAPSVESAVAAEAHETMAEVHQHVTPARVGDEMSAAFLYARSRAGRHVRASPPPRRSTGSPQSTVMDFSSAASSSVDGAPSATSSSKDSPVAAPKSDAPSCPTATNTSGSTDSMESAPPLSLQVTGGGDASTAAPPGHFVGAVMAECAHIFGTRENLTRIACNFLNRFTIYDQLVLSALLTECTDYAEQGQVNADVVAVIFDTVKTHIAIRDGDRFTLKRRASDIKESKWSIVCADVFSSALPPLPTPAYVYSEFYDALLGEELAGIMQDGRLDMLQRKHAIASAMTLLIYPYFDAKSSEAIKMQASNEVFFAAGFTATLAYADPIVRTLANCCHPVYMLDGINVGAVVRHLVVDLVEFNIHDAVPHPHRTIRLNPSCIEALASFPEALSKIQGDVEVCLRTFQQLYMMDNARDRPYLQRLILDAAIAAGDDDTVVSTILRSDWNEGSFICWIFDIIMDCDDSFVKAVLTKIWGHMPDAVIASWISAAVHYSKHELLRWLVWVRGVRAGDDVSTCSFFEDNVMCNSFQLAIVFGDLTAAHILVRAGMVRESGILDHNIRLLDLAYMSGPDILKFVLDNICSICPDVPVSELVADMVQRGPPTRNDVGYIDDDDGMDPLAPRQFDVTVMQSILHNFNLGESKERAQVLLRMKEPVVLIQSVARRYLAHLRAMLLRMLPDNLFDSEHSRRRLTILKVNETCKRMRL
ncbi:hypothetical protein JKP88DRAFT_244825 [Tribonema minus]|uniref:Uncharacterized protein n=1 Tax=Tribonema minus TaxID=303371 RepID=A0A836CG35_9STRA|nr:hypothetical protein JKP88DRAFT_244825 [Tribonema minus]